MHFEIRWLVNQELLYMHFTGEINEVYMQHVIERIRKYLNHVKNNTPVHFIVSASEDCTSQLSVSRLFEMLYFLIDSPVEYLVRVGPTSPKALHTIQLMARSLHMKYQQFDRLEDAVIFLNAADATNRSKV